MCRRSRSARADHRRDQSTTTVSKQVRHDAQPTSSSARQRKYGFTAVAGFSLCEPAAFFNTEKPEREPMSAFNREKVLSVRHWTDTLFSFTATRNSGFRFLNGQFAMIGLEVDGRPLLRAYSMASANHEEALEFFSIKVADGPLTSRLQQIREGDTILVGRKPTGTLITGNLIPGKRLLLLSTGTGLAPFASLVKDPDVYDAYETIILAHGCRQVSKLAYGERLVENI